MLMRRAKIIATIGPSSSSVDMIEKLILSGMNAARINMSHGTYENHAKTIKNVRKASERVGKEVAILLDLQGPKIRVDKLSQPLILNKNEHWYIGTQDAFSKSQKVEKFFIPTVYKDLAKDAQVGSRILFDDGLIEAVALEKENELLKIKVIVGGELKSNKGINLPDDNVSAPSLTDKDKDDLFFGLKEGVDYIAMSFVRTAEDVLELKSLLHKMRSHIPIVSKIERPEAVTNIEEIIQATDVIMVARGDMGVEVGNHLVPAIQKNIIKLCNDAGKPVITATQMLESMITHSRPTRAEASDVANAIWDGTDCVMLSGETASGLYPVEAVKTMSEIVLEAEKCPPERPLLRHMDISSVTASVQVAASIVAEKLHARWIISITEGGNSCLKMTKFRPKRHVLGVTNSIHVMRRMSLYWGVSPYFFDIHGEDDLATLEGLMIDQLKSERLLNLGDKVVITLGDGRFFRQTRANSLRVEIIKNLPKALKHTDQDSIQEVSFDKGKILLDTTICASCQACLNVCPFQIWEVSRGDNNETRINVENASKCTLDMACIEACPTGAIEIFPFT